MGKYDGPEYRIINEIIAADEQRERLKPRIDCPRHGNILIRATCRKCLSCIVDEKRVAATFYSYTVKPQELKPIFAYCYKCRKETPQCQEPNHEGTTDVWVVMDANMTKLVRAATISTK
jgi:hypothetical protein